MEDGAFSPLYDVENRTLGAVTTAGNRYLSITCRGCSKSTIPRIDYACGWRPEWHMEALARRLRCDRGACGARWPIIRSLWRMPSANHFRPPTTWGGGAR